MFKWFALSDVPEMPVDFDGDPDCWDADGNPITPEERVARSIHDEETTYFARQFANPNGELATEIRSIVTQSPWVRRSLDNDLPTFDPLNGNRAYVR